MTLHIDEKVSRLAFATVQIENAIRRIYDDPKFRTLGDDAKMDLGGIQANVTYHLLPVLEMLKAPKSGCIGSGEESIPQ